MYSHLYVTEQSDGIKSKKFYQYMSAFFTINPRQSRSQGPRGLRRMSAAARLLRLWVRNPLGTWMLFCCECCVLSGRSFCDELITSSVEFFQICDVVMCDLETS